MSEPTRQRLTLLARTGAILSASLDVADTIAAVAELVAPALADLCVVYLVGSEGTLERAEVRNTRADKASVIERLGAMPTFSMQNATPIFGALAGERAPVHLRPLPTGFWGQLAHGDEHRALLESLDIREVLAVPLVARGRTIGALVLATIGAEREYGDDDVTFVAEIGRRMAAAIDHARLHEAAKESTRRADESRAVSETLLAAAPVGYVQLDTDLRIVRVSETTAELHARSVDEHVGETLPAILGDTAIALEDAFRTALRTGRARHGVQVDVRLPGFGGEERNLLLNVYPLRNAGGEVNGVAGVTMDNTDSVRGRRMLAFHSEASRLLSETLDLESTVSRLARLALGVFADYSAVVLAATAQEGPQIADAHVDAARDLPDSLRAAWLRSAERGRLADVLLRERPVLLNDADHNDTGDDAAARDAMRALGARAALLVPLSVRGSTIGALVFVRSSVARPYDLSEVTLAEEISRRAAVAVDNARLYQDTERANRAKADFLATMSHELRTPLNAIAGYTELLQIGMHGPLTELQRDDLRRIQRNQRHLLGLINNILNFAKLEAGRVPFHIVTTRIAPLLAGLEELIGPQARSRGVDYSYESCDAGITVRVDQDKLEQIALNLLSNAVKFTAPGGRVTLACVTEGERVLIRVHDTGAGIPGDQLDTIFEPFVQIDSGLTRAAEGTGLGLAISRELARAMGGTLSVESAVGVGSTFTLSLPMMEAES